MLATGVGARRRSKPRVDLWLQAVFAHTTVAAQAHPLVKAWIDPRWRGNVAVMVTAIETASDDA